MAIKKLSIFVSHPSDLLTDHQPHGDGLVAFEFISRLAQRGHTLHVAGPKIELRGRPPSNAILYEVKTRSSSMVAHRIEYMTKMRLLLNRIRRHHKVDVVHQLNPVNRGLNISLVGTRIPLVLGPFVSHWPSNAGAATAESNAATAVLRFLKQSVVNVTSYQRQQQAAALLVTTPAALNKFYKPASIAHKIYCLPHGIDLDFFSPNEFRKSREEKPLSVLFLANIWYRKGIFTLLDAFELVAQVLPSCRLKIAGSGSEMEEMKRRVSNMACQSRIDVLGKVERAEVPSLMRQCSVYCLPSYGEPFGMSALEAMACGKPVVATDAGGLKYLVTEQGGRKVPPGDARKLADALLDILSSPELQAKMGRYNRCLAEKEYSWDRVTERLESIYYGVSASVINHYADAGLNNSSANLLSRTGPYYPEGP